MVRASRRSAEAAPPPRSVPGESGSNRGGPYTKARRSDNARHPGKPPRLCGKPSHAVYGCSPSPAVALPPSSSRRRQGPIREMQERHNGGSGLRLDYNFSLSLQWITSPEPGKGADRLSLQPSRDHICRVFTDAAARSRRMSNLAVTNDLFFDRTGMEPGRVEKLVGEALSGMDDGELFLEYSQSESVALDDGRIKSASFDTTQGFGLRAVAGEAAGYAHASELSEAAIKRAATAVRAVASGHAGSLADPPQGTNRSLYTDLNPLGIVDLGAKTTLLTEIDAYARSRDPRVRQVMASLSGVWQAVQIVRPDGRRA